MQEHTLTMQQLHKGVRLATQGVHRIVVIKQAPSSATEQAPESPPDSSTETAGEANDSPA